jgi:hypothetical protein
MSDSKQALRAESTAALGLHGRYCLDSKSKETW